MRKRYMDIKFGEKIMPKGIFAKDSGGGDFEQPEAGSYIARCYKLIDIGTQPVVFQGKPSDPKRQVIVYFELLEDEDGNEYRMSSGKLFSIQKTYTLSTNAKATLRKHIDSWRGKALTNDEAKEFNIVVLLDKYARVQIILKDSESGDRTYVKLADVGFTKKHPDGVNEATWWTIEEPDAELFDTFPEWLQTKIQGAEEWPQAKRLMSGLVQEAEITETGDVVLEEIDESDSALDLDDLAF